MSAPVQYPDDAIRRFWLRVTQLGPEECWEWRGARQARGHGLLSVKGKNLKAHRISYELHVGPIPPGLCIRHKCDNAPCVNPAHLETGTRADNNRDRDERGRHWALAGEQHNMVKLSDAQVVTIRRLGDERVLTRKAIAKQFNISEGHVYALLRGKLRTDVA